MILCSTPSKREVKMSLNKTDSWVWKGSERRVETDSETMDETFDETDNKQNEKTTLNLLYPRKTMDRNISSPIPFTSLKVKLCRCHCHCPQSSGVGKHSF
jgi:hypothetical protein